MTHPDTVASAGRPLRVLGDIHGDYRAFRTAADAVLEDGRDLFLLGDLINRGPQSLACIDLALDLIARGRLDLVPGNHERRAELYLQGANLTEKDRSRLARLLDELDRTPSGHALLQRYIAHCQTRPVYRRFGRTYLAHGALPADALAEPAPLFGAIGRGHPREQIVDGVRHDDGTCCYGWLDQLPGDVTVVIGHDPVALDTPGRRGGLGARLIHLDSGCGRDPEEPRSLLQLDLERDGTLAGQPAATAA